jgi:hypothetical protein
MICVAFQQKTGLNLSACFPERLVDVRNPFSQSPIEAFFNIIVIVNNLLKPLHPILRSMMQPNPQFLSPEESQAVDGALLSQSEKFLTRLTISSLRLLQIIAEEEKMAIADLTAETIIAWFEKDAKRKREQTDEAVLSW